VQFQLPAKLYNLARPGRRHARTFPHWLPEAEALKESNRTLVLGGGIIGLCCALALQKNGHKVTIIDPEAPGSQTSFGNAGGIAVTEVVPLSLPGTLRNTPKWLLDPAGPLYIRWSHLPALLPWLYRFVRAGSMTNVARIVPTLTLLLKDVYQDFEPLLQAAGIAQHLHRGGSLTLYKRRSTFQSDSLEWEIKRQQGVRCEVIGPADISDLEPNLAPVFEMAVRNLDWGHVDDPYQICTALFKLFLRDGGDYLQARVVGFQREGAEIGGVMTDTNDMVTASKVVIAAGVWSRNLLKILGCNVCLESERGYHVTLANPGASLNNMIIAAEDRFVMTPMSMGLRVAGTAEFGGLLAAPNPQRTDVLVRKARELIPGLNTGQPSTWSGHRPATPDSLPVIGTVPNCSNVYCAFGHGHMGLTLGPTTGRLMAELIAGEGDARLLGALRVDRRMFE